jgi:hypothetical protein
MAQMRSAGSSTAASCKPGKISLLDQPIDLRRVRKDSNIHWQWTPNGYLASILAWLAALLLTVGLTSLIDKVRR